MQPAGARALREDDNEMSREAVLLQWERKIEAAERREASAERRDGRATVPVAEPADREPAPSARREPAPRPTRRAERPPSRAGRRARSPSGARSRSPASPRRRAGAARWSTRQLGPARPDRPLGLPARPLPGGRRRRHRARLAPAPRYAGSIPRPPVRRVLACSACLSSPILTGRKSRAESEAAMKTKESRFQVHDELTAPERSVPILKGALAGGGQLPNFIGVLAGSPAVLRAYARFRSELRNGALPLRHPAAHRARGRRAPGQRVRARPRSSAPPATPASASTRSRSRASSTRATSARPCCCAS